MNQLQYTIIQDSNTNVAVTATTSTTTVTDYEDNSDNDSSDKDNCKSKGKTDSFLFF